MVQMQHAPQKDFTNNFIVTGDNIQEIIDFLVPKIRLQSQEFYKKSLFQDLSTSGKSLIDVHAGIQNTYSVLYVSTDMVNLKHTLMPLSYWGKSGGMYQKENDEFFEKLVPQSGCAETLHGELIRGINRLVYDYNNNGNGNAVKIDYSDAEENECPECGGSGEYHGEKEDETGNTEILECETCCGSGTIQEDQNEDYSVAPMFAQFLKLIVDTVPYTKSVVEKIESVITASPYHTHSYFNSRYQNYYNELSDRVIYYVLNNTDQPLPTWYNKD